MATAHQTAAANVPAAVAPQQQTASLAQWVRNASVRERIVNSLGTVMPADQFIAHALVSFQNPEIKACTLASQLHCLLEMAAMGLLQTLGQCALIVYWNSEIGQSEVKLIVQWQGMKAVAERHPSILEVHPCLVHIRDQFAYINGVVEHSYDPFDPERTINSAADIRGGYLRIQYRDGRPDKYHFTSVAHIEKCRMCAKPSKKTGKREVWDNWYEAQSLKTLVRDAYARRAFPVDPLAAGRMEQMLRTDDALLGNDPNRVSALAIDAPPDAEPAKPLSKAERMAAALAAKQQAEESPNFKTGPGYVSSDPKFDPNCGDPEESVPQQPQHDAIGVQSSAADESQSEPPMVDDPPHETDVIDEPPPDDANQAAELEANAALADWANAIMPIASDSSLKEFERDILPMVPEHLRPLVEKCIAAKRAIGLAASLTAVNAAEKEQKSTAAPAVRPFIEKMAETKRRRIHDSRGPRVNSGSSARGMR